MDGKSERPISFSVSFCDCGRLFKLISFPFVWERETLAAVHSTQLWVLVKLNYLIWQMGIILERWIVFRNPPNMYTLIHSVTWRHHGYMTFAYYGSSSVVWYKIVLSSARTASCDAHCAKLHGYKTITSHLGTLLQHRCNIASPGLFPRYESNFFQKSDWMI